MSGQKDKRQKDKKTQGQKDKKTERQSPKRVLILRHQGSFALLEYFSSLTSTTLAPFKNQGISKLENIDKTCCSTS